MCPTMNSALHTIFLSSRKLVKSSAKAVHLISLPSTSMPVMSLFCLMAARRDSKAKINREGERGSPCLTLFD